MSTTSGRLIPARQWLDAMGQMWSTGSNEHPLDGFVEDEIQFRRSLRDMSDKEDSDLIKSDLPRCGKEHPRGVDVEDAHCRLGNGRERRCNRGRTQPACLRRCFTAA